MIDFYMQIHIYIAELRKMHKASESNEVTKQNEHTSIMKENKNLQSNTNYYVEYITKFKMLR